MPMPTKSVVLFDQTSAANTILDTDTYNAAGIDTSMYDSLTIAITAIGGVHAGGVIVMLSRDVTPAVNIATYTIPAASSWSAFTAASGTTPSNAQSGAAVTTIPNRLRLTVPAAGVGVSTRVVIYGRRNFHGQSSGQNQDLP